MNPGRLPERAPQAEGSVAAASAARPLLSVVLPAHGEAHTLPRLLEAYARQTLSACDFEVIVVVDGPSESIEQALKTAQCPYRLRWFVRPHRGETAARNFGLSQAAGDIVVSSDDDTIPVPEFLERHWQAHQAAKGIVILGGLLDHPQSPEGFLGRTVGPMRGYYERLSAAGYAPSSYDLSDANFSARREDLLDAGGWDQMLAGYGGADDAELGYRLQGRGLRFQVAPQALAYHNYAKGLAGVLRHARVSGRAQVYFAGRHPEQVSRLSLARICLGPAWMRLLLHSARYSPEFVFSLLADRIAPRFRNWQPRHPKLAAVFVKAAKGLFLCRGYWDDAKGMRAAMGALRSQGELSRWRVYWSHKQLPEHRLDEADFYRRLAGELAPLFGEHAGGNVLEIGCGNGALFPYLPFDPRRYRGVDFSESMLAAFQQRHPGLSLVCGDGSSFLDTGRSCDLVFSNGVVQHFDRTMLERHFANAARMIRPGGRFICASVPWLLRWFSYRPGGLLARFRNRLLRGNGLGYWYSKRRFRRLAARHGFSVEFVSGTAYPYSFHAVMTRR